MSEDIHNNDESFREAYERSKEEPSADVWNKINAELDRQDAVYYRKRFIVWRYIACLLILISGGVLSYYTYFDNTYDAGKVGSIQPSTNNKANTPSSTSLSNRDSDLNKKNRIGQAHSLSNEKTDFSFDPVDPATKNKNGLLHEDDSNENVTTLIEARVHASLDVSPFKARKNIRYSTFDSNKNAIKNNGITFHHSKTDVTKLVIADKNEKINNGSDHTLDSNNQIIDVTHSEQNQDSVLMARSSLERNADSLLITRNNHTHYLLNQSLDSISAQHSTKASIKIKSRFSPYWTVTPFISADVMNYQLDDDEKFQGGNNEPDDKGDIQERESHELSYTTGIVAALQYKPRLGFKTGLQCSYINIGINPQTLYAVRNDNQNASYKFITSSGYAYVHGKNGNQPNIGDSAITNGAEHNLTYLNIPLLITYKLYSGKKLSIDVGTGLSAHLLLGSKIITEIEDATGDEQHVTVHKLQGLRHQYFSFVADATLNWRISSRLGFTLLPFFKYAITPITKENIVKTFPFGVGFGAGISYRL